MQGTSGASRWILVVLVVVLGASAVIAAAFLVGDQSASDPTRDRTIQPIGPSPTLARLLGAATLMIAVTLVVTVVRMTRSRPSSGKWTTAALSFAFAGGVVGFAYGAGTAQVIGANIGFGIVMLGAIWAVPFALLVGTVAMVRSCRQDRQNADARP